MSPNAPNRSPVIPASDSRNGSARRGWWRWAFVAGYMGVLFFVSAQSSLPSLTSLPFLTGLPVDKQEHFVAYAILSMLVTWAAIGGRWREVSIKTVVIAIMVSSAYGYTDEYHQRFVPSRSYDLWDWTADTAGASAAAGLAWAWSILLRGRSRIHGV